VREFESAFELEHRLNPDCLLRGQAVNRSAGNGFEQGFRRVGVCAPLEPNGHKPRTSAQSGALQP
jgi:hypothetical protein